MSRQAIEKQIMSRVSTLQAKALFIHGWYNKGIRVYNHIVKWVNVSGTAGFRADPQKAMAQTASLKIIEFIRGGDRCVCEIFPATGEELSNT